MGISCDFEDITFRHGECAYGCFVERKQTPENRELELTGKHLNGKGNNDVTYVQFLNCTVVKIPQGLTNIFPNLKCLEIYDSKLKKISKFDLAEYKNLEKIIIEDNELDYLPGDLFEGFRNLEYIDFEKNNLKLIEPNILDGLNKLKNVNFLGNSNYNICYSIYPVYKPNANLQELKADLLAKFYARFQFVDNLKKSERILQQKIQHLDQDKNKLVQQNKKMNETEADLTGQLLISNTKIIFMSKEIENLKSRLDTQVGLTIDIKAFIKDEATKDFQIQIDDREFPVHKFLLAARSPTLAEILKYNPEVENLNLVDISVEIFEIILKFLYTDELPVEDETNFLHLFAAAGKLKIEKLKNYAGNKVIELIDEDTAVDIFRLGFKYDNPDMRQKSFDKIKEKYPKINFKDEWAVDPEKVMKIIEIFKKKEEAMRKIEEEFESSLKMDL